MAHSEICSTSFTSSWHVGLTINSDECVAEPPQELTICTLTRGATQSTPTPKLLTTEKPVKPQ